MHRAPIASPPDTPVRIARSAVTAAVTPLLLVMAVLVLVLMATGLPATAGTDLLDSDDLLVTTIPNDFYPAEAELSDCLSALPPPGCGSEAKGGWPQFAAMAFIVVGIGAIATRVLWSVRRARRASAVGPNGADPGQRADVPTSGQA